MRSKLLILLFFFMSSPAWAQMGGGIFNPGSGGGSSGGGDVSSSTATSTNATTARTVAQHFGDILYGQDYGMKCDGNIVYDMTLTQSSSTVSSTSYTFTAADVGKHINVSATNFKGAANVTTTIASVSGGNAVLTAGWTASTVSGTGVAVMYKTDDTTAFNNALSTIHTDYPNGAKLFLNGYCVVGASTIYRQEIVGCANGYQSCTLIEKPATNANWIISENQASLTGTGANYGTNTNVPSFFGFENIHLYGNAPAQTSGDTVDFYGNAEIIKGNNLIESAWGNCIHTEAANLFPYDPSDWRAEEEGFFDHLTTRDCGTYGWLDQGPHDSVLLDYVSFGNGSDGFISQTSSTLYTGSVHAEKMHVYDNVDGTAFNIGAPLTAQEVYPDFGNLTINSGGVNIDHLVYTACGYLGLECLITPTGVFNWHIGMLDIQMLNTANNLAAVDIQAGGGNGVIDGYQMSVITPGSNVTAFKIRSPFVTLGTGVINGFSGTGGVCFDIQTATFLNIGGSGFSCTTFFSFGTSTGEANNTINFQAYTAAGTDTLITGTPGTNDVINIVPDTGIPQIIHPGMYLPTGGFWTGFFSNGNSGTSKALDLDNGPNQILTITGAVTVTQTTPTHTGCYKVFLKQDASGHTFSLSGILWPGGAPTFSTAANKIDEASICYDGTNYYGNASISFQ